ncbi:MAG TPA: MDR family MFS transporter [Ktedonobacterales bacterium]|nr:MDR family MFS transporter [Ktedonobacterales bacterium]
MDTQTISTQQQDERRLHGAALGAIITALMLTLLLEALDQTVVSTALPRIIATLQGFDRYTWAVTAYTLASTTMVPIVGKLSDQFGRKWFLVVGIVIFLVGSALSGASQTMTQFIASRAIQGLGAGIGIALAFVVVADMFPPAERVKWQSLFGVVYGVSNLVGPTLGGWLTDHGPLLGRLVVDTTRWRWVFYINLPIGVITLAALLIYLPANISERSNRHTGWAAARRIDFAGAVLSAAATICLLLGLTWGSAETYAWNSPQVIGILAAAGVLYALFMLAERFAVEPILPLDLFRNRVYTTAAALSLVQMMVLVGLIIYLPLFLQGVLGVSAINSGEVITPLTLSSVAGAAIAGGLVTKFKRYQAVTVAAAVIMTVGVFLLTRITPSTALGQIVVFMIVAGVGLGVFFSVLTVAGQNALARARLGIGTSALRYLSQLGAVLGVALVGTVVNNSISTDLAPRLQRIQGASSIPPAVLKVATNPQVLVSSDQRNSLVQGVLQHVPPAFQQSALHTFNQIFDALKQSLSVAVVQGFIVVLILCIVMVLGTLLLKDILMKATQDEAGAEAEESEAEQTKAALQP